MHSANNIGVAVIGAGRIGRIHAVNACANLNARVLHVHDASRDNQDALADLVGAKPASLEEIFASKSVDAVLVCSPTDTHVELITAAAEAGKAVFCEKPVDLDAERVKSCLAIVEAKGVPFGSGANSRRGKASRVVLETSSLEDGIPHCRRKSTLDTQTSQSELCPCGCDASIRCRRS